MPTHAIGPDLGNPALFENLPLYLAQGYGDLQVQPGDPYKAHTIDGSSPPQLEPTARRILRFATMGDFQLMDDESPTRVGFLDAKTVTDSSLRPHDPYLCHMANAAVRTLNGLHRMDPISMVFIGGDTLDSAQSNEADWALGILRGGEPVECDSGEDNDLVPGPGNDPKDPFLPEGLLVPWKWVPGNHDMLIQGNGVVSDSRIDVAVGDFSPFGTRDYRRDGAIVQSPIVPDLRRRPLTPRELIAKIAGDVDGHGVSQAQAESGMATYFVDVVGTPIRFLVVDSVSKTGGAGGVIRQSDYLSTIRPILDESLTLKKWVILLSDNSTTDLGQANAPLGTAVPDPIGQTDWRRLLGGYPNLLYSMARSYEQSIRAVRPPGGHAFWEILNGAVADSPFQLRLFELWDANNSFLLLRATCIDLAVDDDPLAREGRRRAITDVTATWRPKPADTSGLRNVDLWIRKP